MTIYVKLCLECAAPKRWSKYTTPSYLIGNWHDIFWFIITDRINVKNYLKNASEGEIKAAIYLIVISLIILKARKEIFDHI